MKRYPDNKGATLVFSVVTITVISVLVSLILAIVVSNFRNKSLDYKARQDFYSAETAASEVYSGVGTYAVSFLGKAYTSTLSGVAINTLDATNSILYESTTALNQKFKLEYISLVVEYFSSYSASQVKQFINEDRTDEMNTGLNEAANVASITSLLRDCVSGSDTTTELTILSGSGDSVYFDKDAYTLSIYDVNIVYKDEEYLSSETFDIEIKFPDWSILNIVSSSENGNPYIAYALVGENGLTFETATIDGLITSVTGGIYGGGTAKTTSTDSVNGITIEGAPVSVSLSNTVVIDGKVYQGAVVSNADIVVDGTISRSASFTVDGGKVWCSNILIPYDSVTTGDKAADIVFGSNADVYVRDDLEINGSNGSVSISGGYYGYGMNISSGGVANSSAIIVNGKNAVLTVNPTASLYVAGRSYIYNKSTADEMAVTGESISLRGNQQAYLVPNEWMVSGKTNPCAQSDYVAGSMVDMTSVPAAIQALLDSSEPVKAVQTNSNGYHYYIYFNFANSDNAETYIVNAANGVYGTVLKNMIDSNNIDILNIDSVQVNAGSVISSGAISQKTGDTSVTVSSGNSSGISTVAYNNYSSRSSLMESLLVSVDESETLINKTSAGGRFYASSLFSYGPVTNHVDLVTLSEAPYSDIDEVIAVGSSNVRVIYKDGGSVDYDYTDGYTTIIVCNGDVSVSRNFKGMILATGEVTVSPGLTISSDAALVHESLQSGVFSTGDRIGEVFKYYQTITPSLTDNIDEVRYSDVIEFKDWRKY